MKVCVPAADNVGLQSQPFGHFGSAPFFVMHDTESKETEIVENPNAAHEHGACQPVAALGGRTVEAILVGGIGARAIAKLNADGIRVYRAEPGTVEENLASLTAGQLAEITPAGGCQQHGGCSH